MQLKRWTSKEAGESGSLIINTYNNNNKQHILSGPIVKNTTATLPIQAIQVQSEEFFGEISPEIEATCCQQFPSLLRLKAARTIWCKASDQLLQWKRSKLELVVKFHSLHSALRENWSRRYGEEHFIQEHTVCWIRAYPLNPKILCGGISTPSDFSAPQVSASHLRSCQSTTFYWFYTRVSKSYCNLLLSYTFLLHPYSSFQKWLFAFSGCAVAHSDI